MPEDAADSAEVQSATESVRMRVDQVLAQSGSDLEIIAGQGPPGEEILKRAESWNADLVVLGSHGITGTTARLLGGVTHKVIRSAH